MPAWWQAVLLVAGAATLVMSGFQYRSLLQRHEAVRWHLNVLGQTSASANPTITEQSGGNSAEDQVKLRLAFSWQPVFVALESATSQKISLLSIDCTGLPGSIHLAAEARNLADALDYVGRLNRSTNSWQAELIRYQTKENDPEHPVGFEITAEVNS